MEPTKILIVTLLFILTIIIHEFIHYLTLRRMGGIGKLSICKGSFHLPTIGIRYMGGLKNWKQVVDMKLAPMPATFICFFIMSFFIVEPSNFMGYLLVFAYGVALTWITCLKDLRDVRAITAMGTEENFEELFKPGMGDL